MGGIFIQYRLIVFIALIIPLFARCGTEFCFFVRGIEVPAAVFACYEGPVLFHKIDGKAHLHHDKQGIVIPYDQGLLFCESDLIGRGNRTIGTEAF